MTTLHKRIGAEGGTRTPTGFLPQPPQGCVSTVSPLRQFLTTSRTTLYQIFSCLSNQKLSFINFFYFFAVTTSFFLSLPDFEGLPKKDLIPFIIV